MRSSLSSWVQSGAFSVLRAMLQLKVPGCKSGHYGFNFSVGNILDAVGFHILETKFEAKQYGCTFDWNEPNRRSGTRSFSP